MADIENLKICVVGPVPPPYGGMANQTAELCRLLNNEGVDVTLIATNTPYKPAWIRHLKGVRAVVRLIGYCHQLWRSVGKADIVHMMANSGWSWHLFAAPAIWIAYLRNTPVVVNYRGGYADQFFRRSWRWVAPTLKTSARVVVPSEFLSDVFASYGVATTIIPNTLNTDRFYPDKIEEVRRIDSPVLAVTRNLEAIYGIDLVLQAFKSVIAEYPNAKLVIAGSGPDEAALKTLTIELGIESQVTFCGRLQQDEIAELYRRSDLLVNASRVDNSPNSIIEALGCGLPVVSTNVGGIPRLVKHLNTAYLVEPESAPDLAKGILYLLNNKQAYTALRTAGIELSGKFHWSSVKQHLLSVYLQAWKTAP